MGKKMKLPFSFKNTETTSPWAWPSCGSPKTLSFRANYDILKTMNSAYQDTSTINLELVDTPHHEYQEYYSSCFTSTNSYDQESRSFSSTSGDYMIENVIRGLRSERLFFEPGESSSILEEAKTDDGLSPYKESTVVMAMESQDPYVDFKRSMEEMVEAHGLKDWECLEALLSWFLRVNENDNYGYIVSAFVDLLVGIAFDSSTASLSSDHDNNSSSSSSSVAIAHSPTSPLSFSCFTSSTSPCLSSLQEVDEDEIEKIVDNGSSSTSSYSSSSSSSSSSSDV